MHSSCIIFSRTPLTEKRLCTIMDQYYVNAFYDRFNPDDDILDSITPPEFLWDYWDIQQGFPCWQEDIKDTNEKEDLFNIDASRATDKLGCCTFIDLDLVPHVHKYLDCDRGSYSWVDNIAFKDQLKETVEKAKAVNGYFTILDYHW